MARHEGLPDRRPVIAGPTLSLVERDRRWAGLRQLMEERSIDAIVVGSFQGRERLESYLINDFFDSIVVFPQIGPVTVLTFADARVSRVFECERRGIEPWVRDFRIGFGGARTAEILLEKEMPNRRVGVVGLQATAAGEAEGFLPLGFYRNLTAGLQHIEVVDFTRELTDFILVKSEEERAVLRFSAEVSEQACLAMIDAARPGVSEADVFAEIKREIHRWGADLRYPFLTLQSGRDNISWGAPSWSLRAEPPRMLEEGDLVQAEIHTAYGAQESQVQMSVVLGPGDKDIHTCEAVARRSYEAGLKVIRPGITFAEVAEAMERPLALSGCWAKTPLLHTFTWGAVAFSWVNRGQIEGTHEELIDASSGPSLVGGDLVLQEGMALELEPNACLGMKRVNIGGGVLVTADGAEELNCVSTRVHYKHN